MNCDLWILSLDEDGKAFPWLQTQFNEQMAFSLPMSNRSIMDGGVEAVKAVPTRTFV
jgi:hypothetical protein